MSRRSIILAAVIILCIGVGAWWLAARPSDILTPSITGQPPANLPLKPAREARAGYTEYRNERYRFALFYPDGLKVKEYDEGNGATTITFQNTTTAEGFQIFVVPYGEQKVSDARFRQDEPSGVRLRSKGIQIDGVAAVSFYSTNAALGETAEIWFVYGGYLFEITTLKPLAGRLSEIMLSWEFI